MTIPVRCPSCETVFNLPDEHLGKKIRCKNCQTAFVTEEFIEKPKPKTKPPKLPEPSPRKNREVEEDIPEEEDDETPRKRNTRTSPREDDDEEEVEEERPRKKKKKKKKKSNAGLLIGLGVAVVLVLGGGVAGVLYLTLGGKSKETKPNEVAQNNTPTAPKSLPAPAGDPVIPPAANPVIPPQDLKRYTISNARITTSSAGTNGPAFKGASGKSLIFNFKKNQQTPGVPVFMIVIVPEVGEKMLLTGGNGPVTSLAKNEGTLELLLSAGGGRPGGKGGGGGSVVDALPGLGKNLKVYIAVRAGGIANAPSEGERLSNIADLTVE